MSVRYQATGGLFLQCINIFDNTKKITQKGRRIATRERAGSRRRVNYNIFIICYAERTDFIRIRWMKEPVALEALKYGCIDKL